MPDRPLFDVTPEKVPDEDHSLPTDMWDGWDELAEPPDESAHSAVTQEERADVDLAEFWRSRSSLGLLHQWAKARRVGPWAVLGAALARAVANVPPSVVLPPTTGGPASLNMFVGLVGLPGVGKDSAQNVARVALSVQLRGAAPVLEAPVGSGEGLAHMFMKAPRKGEDEATQHNTKAIVRIGEIDTLSAQQSRSGSTLSAQLRMANMGEEIGAFYADTTKRMIIPRHRYRLCMIAGIQPARSAVLLDDAEGGTPQRWLWLPAGDPAAQLQVPDLPPPLVWEVPDLTEAKKLHEAHEVFNVMDLPQATIDAQIQVRLAGLHEAAESLDAHAVLTRTKVAAALALLEQRLDVTDEDWRLSGVIMAVSDAQRARCVRALGEVASTANERKARAEAHRAVVVEAEVDQHRRKRVADWLGRRLAQAGPAGMGRSELRRALPSRDREVFDASLDALLVAGTAVPIDPKNPTRFTHV